LRVQKTSRVIEVVKMKRGGRSWRARGKKAAASSKAYVEVSKHLQVERKGQTIEGAARCGTWEETT
jgi:hypothetical protein